jgi:hypothetical protein
MICEEIRKRRLDLANMGMGEMGYGNFNLYIFMRICC